MTTKAYVLLLLENYRNLIHRASILEFELANLKPLHDAEMIEAMALYHPQTECISIGGGTVDRTSNVALEYKQQSERQYLDAKIGIQTEIKEIRSITDRLEIYVENLPKKSAAAIKGYYFEGKTWPELQGDDVKATIKTLMRRRDKGVEILTDLYDRIIKLGILNTEDLNLKL